MNLTEEEDINKRYGNQCIIGEVDLKGRREIQPL